jgi:hypothetical protein
MHMYQGQFNSQFWVFLEKVKLTKSCKALTVPECLVMCSHGPNTGPYGEPAESALHPDTLFF